MEQTNPPTVSLSLTVRDTARALRFYADALDAEEVFRLPTPDGGVAHAEFMVGNTRIYISDEAPDWHAFAMPEGGLASCLLSIVVDDCDKAYEQAVDVGAQSLSPPQDQFWGMRSAVVKVPFGYRWSFGQMVEDVTPEELARRARDFFASLNKGRSG